MKTYFEICKSRTFILCALLLCSTSGFSQTNRIEITNPKAANYSNWPESSRDALLKEINVVMLSKTDFVLTKESEFLFKGKKAQVDLSTSIETKSKFWGNNSRKIHDNKAVDLESALEIKQDDSGDSVIVSMDGVDSNVPASIVRNENGDIESIEIEGSSFINNNKQQYLNDINFSSSLVSAYTQIGNLKCTRKSHKKYMFFGESIAELKCHQDVEIGTISVSAE